MDAIVGVWLTSVVGAAAFCAAGYVLGSSAAKPAATPGLVAAPCKPPTPTEVSERSPPPTTEALPMPDLLVKTDEDDDDGDDGATVVHDKAAQAAVVKSSIGSNPPPRTPSVKVEAAKDETRLMIQNALEQVEQAALRQKAVELLKAEAERQVETVRIELRNEVILRAAADARADELADRLAKASEEAATLRHRVNTLDRQTKLLRDSMKGRPATGDRRGRDDEAEEMRVKLRDVVDKLERASLPPGAPIAPLVPPKENEDAIVLREEIARLASENRQLRAQTLGGSLPPKKPAVRESIPDIDLGLYRNVVEKLRTVSGLKAAVIADEVGSLLVGSGELAEGLAAFGAYIRDASARSDRLLPLESVEEIDIRDERGAVLSTRVVLPKAQLSLIVLCVGAASMAAAKKIAADTLRLA